MELSFLKKTSLLSLVLILFFVSCSGGSKSHKVTPVDNQPSKSDHPKTIPPEANDNRAQKTIEKLEKMYFTFDGSKPILEKHLNKKSLVTFIGKKLTPDHFYSKKIKELNGNINDFSQFVFNSGIIKKPDQKVINNLDIVSHREFDGLLYSYGLISTSSSLEVAARFAKDQNIKNQAALIIVVQNEVGTAIDINYIYDDYKRLSGSFWNDEKEYSRVEEILPEEIIGLYYIDSDGIVSNFYKNEKSSYKWDEMPSNSSMQDIWRKNIHPSFAKEPNSTLSNNSQFYWYMDWSDYGSTYKVDAATDKSNHLKWDTGKLVPTIALENNSRYYGEVFNLNEKPMQISTGPKFYLVTSIKNVNKEKKPLFKVTRNNIDCIIEKEHVDEENIFFKITCAPDIENQKLEFEPAQLFYAISSKMGENDDLRHPFDQNFSYNSLVEYESFAFLYWSNQGINLKETDSVDFKQVTYSSECALSAEKAMFAIGSIRHDIKYSIGIENELKKNLDVAKLLLEKSTQEKDGNECHFYGQRVPSFEKWGNLWNGLAEYSLRKSWDSKVKYLNDLTPDHYLHRRWKKEIEKVKENGFIPIYNESQMIWGNGGMANKGMNKVGRFWQFYSIPVMIQKLDSN